MRLAPALMALVLVAGCLPTSPNVPPQQYFVLDSPAKAGTTQRAAPLNRALLIGPTSASPFYDTQNLVYTRAAGQRAYYQFAAWTERPGRRFAELLMRRLEARGGFKSVASTTSGVKGDLVLNTRLEEFYQDVSANPGSVRIEVYAELVDHVERSVVARRRFSQNAPADGANAAAAVTAFNRALSGLLDELSAWVEEAAARPAAR